MKTDCSFLARAKTLHCQSTDVHESLGAKQAQLASKEHPVANVGMQAKLLTAKVITAFLATVVAAAKLCHALRFAIGNSPFQTLAGYGNSRSPFTVASKTTRPAPDPKVNSPRTTAFCNCRSIVCRSGRAPSSG